MEIICERHMDMSVRKLQITINNVEITAELCHNITANLLWESLPITSTANIWGDEIYFEVPFSVEEENGLEVVEIGDLAYWPPGSAICLFFGPTPLSRDSEIRPASPVNLVGKMLGDPMILKEAEPGDLITIKAK
tara:strand:- start:32 stop:436 length:405 start_codon:yes stop_codon:yes gene_type:complete